MNVRTRLLRKPATAIAWLLVLTIMAGLLGVGGTLLHATNAMEDTLSSQHTTIAIRGGGLTVDELGNTVAPMSMLEDTADKLRVLPSVEMVDFRTLTGAYIPELTAKLGLKSWMNLNEGKPYFKKDIDRTTIPPT